MQLALPDPENWYPEPECILPNWQTFFFSQASPIPSLSQADIGTFGLHNFNLIDGISPSREVSPVPSLSSFGSDQSYIKEEDEYQNQTMPAWNYASSPNTGFNSAHGIVALANMLAGNTAFDNNVPPQQTQVTYFSDGPIYDDPDMIHHQYGENELDLVINGLLSHMSAEARNSANEIMVKHPEISKEILCYFFHPPCKKNKLKRNEYASMMRDFGIPYKDIIAVGKLGIAESTLRGAVMKYDLPYNVKELQVYNYAAALYQAVYDAQKRQGIHFTVYNGIDWAWVAWRMWDLMDQQGFKFSANAAKHRWAVEVCKHPGEL